MIKLLFLLLTFIPKGFGDMQMTSTATTTKTNAPAEILRKPLIIGASVSAGFGTLSPGDRLSRRFTGPASIINVARGGTPGRDHDLKSELFKGRTVVLAMDFLFWDSALPQPQSSLNNLDLLLKRAANENIPVVIGDIPELLPGRQPSRDVLNKAIYAKCTAHAHCNVLKLDDLHRQVMRDRALMIKGRRYSFHELVPDGLHLAETAGEFLADKIFELPLFHGG
jgi:hypothetical protein